MVDPELTIEEQSVLLVRSEGIWCVQQRGDLIPIRGGGIPKGMDFYPEPFYNYMGPEIATQVAKFFVVDSFGKRVRVVIDRNDKIVGIFGEHNSTQMEQVYFNNNSKSLGLFVVEAPLSHFGK